MTRHVGWLERGCTWVARLALLNLVWIAFTLLGGVVLGIMPATAAVFAVLARWTVDDDDEPLLRSFWRAYRSRFMTTNLFGYLLVALGYLITMNLSIAWTSTGVLNVGAAVLFLTLMLAYCLAVPHAFSVLVAGRQGVARSFAAAFARGLMHPLTTLLCAVACGAAWLVMIRWAPVLLPFFGISAPALIMTAGARLAHNEGARRRRPPVGGQPGPRTPTRRVGVPADAASRAR